MGLGMMCVHRYCCQTIPSQSLWDLPIILESKWQDYISLIGLQTPFTRLLGSSQWNHPPHAVTREPGNEPVTEQPHIRTRPKAESMSKVVPRYLLTPLKWLVKSSNYSFLIRLEAFLQGSIKYCSSCRTTTLIIIVTWMILRYIWHSHQMISAQQIHCFSA